MIALLLFSLLTAAEPAPKGLEASVTRSYDLGSGRRLELVASPFTPSSHAVRRCKVLEWEGVCLIDEAPIFGTDWDLPTEVLKSATLIVGELRTSLDVSSMFNPKLAIRKAADFKVRTVEGGLTVSGRFADGAGTYEAEWLVIDGRSIRTALRRSEQ